MGTAALDDAMAAIDNCDEEAFGRALHRIQDSYAHNRYKWWSLGHAWTPTPDNSNPEESARDRDMAEQTTDLLDRFRCNCTAP